MADPDESPERWVTCELVYAELWRRRASVRLPRGSRVTRTEWSGRWMIFHVLTDPAPAPPAGFSPPATSSWENPPVPTPTRRERRKESRIQRRKGWRYRDLDEPGGQQTPERAVIPPRKVSQPPP